MTDRTRDTWACPDCGSPQSSLRMAEAIDWRSVAEFVEKFHTSTGICTGFHPTADDIRAHALRTANDIRANPGATDDCDHVIPDTAAASSKHEPEEPSDG